LQVGLMTFSAYYFLLIFLIISKIAIFIITKHDPFLLLFVLTSANAYLWKLSIFLAKYL
jgi:hypothetical protein